MQVPDQSPNLSDVTGSILLDVTYGFHLPQVLVSVGGPATCILRSNCLCSTGSRWISFPNSLFHSFACIIFYVLMHKVAYFVIIFKPFSYPFPQFQESTLLAAQDVTELQDILHERDDQENGSSNMLFSPENPYEGLVCS